MRRLTARVSRKFGGEVSDYEVGETVTVTRIYGNEATVEDDRGYRCIVGVPLDRLDFSHLARAALEQEGRS